MTVSVTLSCQQPECPTKTKTIEVPKSVLEEAINAESNDANEVAYFLGLDELIIIDQVDPETLWWLIKQLYIYYNMKNDIDDMIGGNSTKEPSAEYPLICNDCGEPLTMEDVKID